MIRTVKGCVIFNINVPLKLIIKHVVLQKELKKKLVKTSRYEGEMKKKNRSIFNFFAKAETKQIYIRNLCSF